MALGLRYAVWRPISASEPVQEYEDRPRQRDVSRKRDPRADDGAENSSRVSHLACRITTFINCRRCI